MAFDDLRMLAFGQEPEADGNLGGVEELAGQCDHAIDQVVLKNLAADGSLALGIGGHGPIGQHESGDTVLREFGDHVQDPGVVGIACRRNIVPRPSRIIGKFIARTPCLQVERRIGHDKVGLQVRMLILEKAIGRHLTQIGGDAANGQVHLGQLVRGGGQLLPVDGDVLAVALVAVDKLQRLHEHTARSTAGVIDLALERLDHLGNQVDHAFGRVELTSTLAFSGCEFAQKVLVHPPNDILFLVRDGVDVVDRVDQCRQLAAIQAQAGEVVVGQCALERRVVLLHRMQGRIDLDGNVILLGLLLDM